MEFDFTCSSIENYLDQYFYEGLRSSIKLWLNKEDREELA